MHSWPGLPVAADVVGSNQMFFEVGGEVGGVVDYAEAASAVRVGRVVCWHEAGKVERRCDAAEQWFDRLVAGIHMSGVVLESVDVAAVRVGVPPSFYRAG